MNRYFFVVSLILLFIVIFISFGKSIYMPLIHKIKGKQTVASRIDNLELQVSDRLRNSLESTGLTELPTELIIVVLKEEQVLQVYALVFGETKFLKQYPFTATSGTLGPKLREGDRQIPEGIYNIEYLNPNSLFYLSLKVSYPNEFDKSKTKFDHVSDMGGDIFIHGKSATIGCVPIGDEAIEEVFVLAQKAIGNEIKVIISPRDFRTNNEYPNVESINWENELYNMISEELEDISIPN